jgi:N-acetylmuramoyl-L-alanine amidase
MRPAKSLLAAILTAFIALALSLGGAADTSAAPGHGRTAITIALDPGHGGSDTGAQGPAGALEKEICLKLARELAARLEAAAYRTMLTRSDDYSVPIRQRTAMANQANADLLISIHCGAAFQHATTGMAVYCWQPDAQTPDENAYPSPDGPVPWERVQLPFLAKSRSLATQIRQALQHPAGSEAVEISVAPLRVLQGAAMPAILIEIGHLTNPATETDLRSPQRRQQLVQAIHQGIDMFLAAHQSSGGRQ